MIDTIKIVLRRIDVISYWNVDLIGQRLEQDTLIRKTDSNGNLISITGRIKNISVQIKNDYLTINGSLCKYYFHNNLQTLDTDDIVTAISWLGEDLGLPIQRGYIKRIDVARNIIVRRQVKFYLDSFDDTDGYYKDRYKDRLLYKKSNGTYSLTMYDKVKELKKNDKELYQYNRNGYLKDKNILRCEVKLEQKINQLLKYESVRVVHLNSKTFLKKLNDFWHSNFKSLVTKKSFMFNKEIPNYGEFKKELLVKAIQDIGLINLFKMLEDLRKTGKLTSNQKAYAKENLKRLVSGSTSLIELDQTTELMTQMDFLYKNVDEDEFAHLKKVIVKKHTEVEPKNRLYGDISKELFKISLRDGLKSKVENK